MLHFARDVFKAGIDAHIPSIIGKIYIVYHVSLYSTTLFRCLFNISGLLLHVIDFVWRLLNHKNIVRVIN